MGNVQDLEKILPDLPPGYRVTRTINSKPLWDLNHVSNRMSKGAKIAKKSRKREISDFFEGTFEALSQAFIQVSNVVLRP